MTQEWQQGEFVISTDLAQDLYRKYGFVELNEGAHWMQMVPELA